MLLHKNSMTIAKSNKKKVVTFAGLLILVLVLLNVVSASCLTTGAISDKKNLGESSVPEPTLNEILSDSGINLDVFNDQENYADWNLDSDSVEIEVELIDSHTAYHDVFGYYLGSDEFVPVFAIKSMPEYPDVDVLLPGDKVTILVENADEIKFAIKSSEEPFIDNSVNYENHNKYIFGFEDSSEIDSDFQDIVASIRVLKCGECSQDDDCDRNEYCSSEHKCEKEDDDDNDGSSSNNNNVEFTANCDPLWKCGEWSECVDGIQRRNCEDANLCEIAFNKPTEVQGCSVNLNSVIESTKIKEEGFNYLFWLLVGIGIVLLLIIVTLIVKR